MLKKVNCSICKEAHFDHYACSECQYNLGFVNPRINYCPNCGGKLIKRAQDLRQRQGKNLSLSLHLSRIKLVVREVAQTSNANR